MVIVFVVLAIPIIVGVEHYIVVICPVFVNRDGRVSTIFIIEPFLVAGNPMKPVGFKLIPFPFAVNVFGIATHLYCFIHRRGFLLVCNLCVECANGPALVVVYVSGQAEALTININVVILFYFFFIWEPPSQRPSISLPKWSSGSE